ncbi:hypothetical protein SAMN04488544_2192 [Microlunatus sagamiharensis]|uniref:TolA protein n=1 Tax=Microlunatus sagamiharensis TaxID=546874 RepID=A0A1H2MKA2_9ACTN|nr:hypothetical protein [Microlunatus sagamiharensis]SDU93351.1 hypothetical protein SAMN04488544_2192 [Microlunatus sagamiharensis]
MPAAKPKSPQTKDPYAAQGKALASAVQRLRGWLSTDAARLPELVDALNALVAHRLDGHAYAAAGAEAQEAVKRSAEHLLASGPVGPYSSAPDVVRCGTALVQLAALQAGIGLVEPAGATLASWDGLRGQVAEAGTVVELDAGTGRRALLVAGRVALAEGDAALANAYADAALAVPRPGDDPGFVMVDLERLASDARWAGGRAEQSLGFLHSAKEAYERAGGERLDEPGRLAPALAERLSEPLPALYRDLADRLGALGERDLALANRRLLVDRLRSLVARVEALRPALVSALTDLASDLLAADRAEEAYGVAAEAESAAADRAVPSGPRLLAAAVLARASLAAGHPAPAGPLRGLLAGEGEAAGPTVRGVASAALAELLRAEGLEEAARAALDGVEVSPDRARGVVGRGSSAVSWSPLGSDRAYGAPLGQADGVVAATPTWLEQERAEAQRQEAQRADEVRREAEAQVAEAAREQEAARAAAAARASAEAEEREREETARRAAEEADQAERKRRREERLRQHQAEVDERERAARGVRRDEIDARLAELDAAEEPERDRLLAERGSLDAADAALEQAPTPEVVAAPSAPEPTTVPEPPTIPEPVEGPPAPEPTPTAEPEQATTPEPTTTPEPVEGPPAPEPSEPEPDELDQAEAAYAAARSSGGRRETRAAAERVVELLRPRASADPGAYNARLRTALENLGAARLRTGDLFGSRSANREARTLG